MSNKMLIDASHPEETRVVVTKGNRIEEFDFESEHKKQLKGNIYLARVTRVEPSLQAAFVEYGGNRHGFLAFSEIHPDYYQIPQADRQAILDAQARHSAADNEESEDIGDSSAGSEPKKNSRRRSRNTAAKASVDSITEEAGNEDEYVEEEKPEEVGAEDAMEEVPVRESRPQAHHWRDYKIQEVIKRRQILLVQIVKEERGNKGAALTTYLSLAGRYSVLMPNTARGGGISRKITNIADRKRLKDVVKGLSVPKGMGVILRTAGAARTKTEVRRDYEYLMRLWENVRALTLASTAPALVYEEGSLIKRSIRDLYNKDIDEVLVSGEKGYREAKDFMRMLMPSHAKFVQPYRDASPIFARNGIEAQLDGMLQPEVGLKSGGYLVINQTEALVAIDVNSGRSTREHSVEETALQTNLEAAEEVARQLRLRDLAGLVVIDFIDMQEKRNIRAIEKKLKDCLKGDRARIQIGRISHFGLMEMSRQRIRASVLESTTQPCPHCFGTGYVRSQSSLALHVLRMVEEYLQRSSTHNIMVRTPVSTALYVLNHKRRALNELEERFGLTIDIEADDTIGKEHLAIHKTSEVEPKDENESQESHAVSMSSKWEMENAAKEKAENSSEQAEEDDEPQIEREKQRNGGRNRRRSGARIQADSDADVTEESETSEQSQREGSSRRRRRGRRGGRRNRDSHNAERALPAAEPVGDFAAEALKQRDAEIAEKSAEQRQSTDNKMDVPAAEPVGEFPGATPDENHISGRRRNNRGRRTRRPREMEAAVPADNFEAETVKHSDSADMNNSGSEAEYSNRRNRRRPIAPRENNVFSNENGSAHNEDTHNSVDVAPITKTEHIAEPIGNFDAVAAGMETENDARKTAKARRPRRTIKEAEIVSEPIVTSSDGEAEKPKEKKKGWWGRKSFF